MSEPKENVLMEKIVSLCKRRGFVFQSSEIYGGINGFWDYGPLGAELKRNVKELWWNTMTRQREDVVGLDASIIMHSKVWQASGHVDTFADMMRECPLTKKRVRADQVEPQDGICYSYAGAFDQSFIAKQEANGASFDASSEKPFGNIIFGEMHITVSGNKSAPLSKQAFAGPFEILLSPGKPAESARKAAIAFYQQSGVTDPVCYGEKASKIEKSVDFHPESLVRLGPARPFNLMLQTWVGPIQSDENIAYLRPETAQAIFVQFKNVMDSSRVKTPFGIGQIGKAFRNEVTPRNFTFRSREFEQMELEFFIKPDEAVRALHGTVITVPEQGHPGEPQPAWGWQAWHRYWVEERVRFYEDIGLARETLGFHVQTDAELAHYARACTDILFKFPFSKSDEQGRVAGDELEGIAARGDFDLSQHEKHSGKPLAVFEEEVRAAWSKLPEDKRTEMRDEFIESKTRVFIEKKVMPPGDAAEAARQEAQVFFERLAKGQYIPHVIEPSAGVDRLILALIANAFTEVTDTDDKGKSETRVIMKFHPRVAPIKVGIMPLLKNKPDLVKKALEVRDLLRPHMNVFYDDGGSIGRRYARQDEAGTPYCVTIDFDTLGEKPELLNTVTLRHRDDGKQERLAISELPGWLLAKVR